MGYFVEYEIKDNNSGILIFPEQTKIKEKLKTQLNGEALSYFFRLLYDSKAFFAQSTSVKQVRNFVRANFSTQATRDLTDSFVEKAMKPKHDFNSSETASTLRNLIRFFLDNLQNK